MAEYLNKCLFVLLIFLNIIFLSKINSFGEDIEDLYIINDIQIENNQFFSNKDILSMMETKKKSFWDGLFFWRKGPVFDEGVLEGDIIRLIRRYQRNGFLNIEIQEPEIILNEEDKKAFIIIIINENTRVRVSSIEYNIKNEYHLHEKIIEKIRLRSNIKENFYFQDDAFLADLGMMADIYNEYGYPTVSVNYDLILNDDETEVLIIVNIHPGYKKYFGKISFTGSEKTEERLLGRFLTFNTEDEYFPEKINDTRVNLQSLGLFRLVSINLEVDRESEIMPVDILLQEKPTYDLRFGLGYGLEDRFRIFTELNKMRLFGGLRRGSIYIKHSYLEPFHINFKLIQPAFPTIKSNISFNTYYRSEKEPSYSITRTGGTVTLGHRISRNTNTYISYEYEYNDLKKSSDIDYSEGDNDIERSRYYRKSSISWGLMRDTSRPDLSPNRGTVLSNTFTLSGLGFNSDYPYYRWSAEAKSYHSIRDYLIMALRIRLGVINPLRDNDYIPFEDRFYSGGAYSVRGWSRFMLGPKNEERDPIGGNSLLEGNLELRIPVWQALSAVIFLDFGNVWKEEFDHDLEDLHFGAGFGFRYSTPVGPVRLDIASPIYEGKASWQLYISLGHAF